MIDERLSNVVERVAGLVPHTRGDFDRLSEMVWKRTHERLSPTTLKRLWGYLDEDVQPRHATLDVLARFVGYRHYAAFLQGGSDVQSEVVTSRRLTSDQLCDGQCVCLTWPPDRRVVVRHEGEGCFRVVESENSKLAVDDTFTCHLMLMHEPLYLDNLVHLDAPPTSYVAGKKDGVVFHVL